MTGPVVGLELAGQFLGRGLLKQTIPSTAHEVRASNRQDIGLLASFQHPAKAAVRPVDSVAQNVSAWDAAIERRLDHGARHLWLGCKLDRLRDRRPGTSRPILCPSLRQIKATINQRLAVAARVSQEHADLAVLDPPRRSRVLTRDTGGTIALLHKSRLVDDQDAILIAQRLHHIIANLVSEPISVPVAAPQQRLHPIRPLRSGLLGHSASLSCAQCRKEGHQGNLRPSPATHDEEASAQPVPSAP
ncbi:hypothetical protein X736_33245 [Mesorhizobium sp. L2C089B000]|nr:hypothetical protein X736_33245 [Mesorhizobium sp. L2C089B000]